MENDLIHATADLKYMLMVRRSSPVLSVHRVDFTILAVGVRCGDGFGDAERCVSQAFFYLCAHAE